jgi:hypothetical protein
LIAREAWQFSAAALAGARVSAPRAIRVFLAHPCRLSLTND